MSWWNLSVKHNHCLRRHFSGELLYGRFVWEKQFVLRSGQLRYLNRTWSVHCVLHKIASLLKHILQVRGKGIRKRVLNFNKNERQIPYLSIFSYPLLLRDNPVIHCFHHYSIQRCKQPSSLSPSGISIFQCFWVNILFLLEVLADSTSSSPARFWIWCWFLSSVSFLFDVDFSLLQTGFVSVSGS